MDARIGKLNNGTFYAYVNGYAAEPVMGTLEQVEAALGLRPATLPVQAVKPSKEPKTFSVRMTFEYPSWSTVDGILYTGIIASSKQEACKRARKMAEDAGHAVGGIGKYWFKAEEEK